MFEWHNAQKMTPPAGKLLHINYLGNYGNDWVCSGFYTDKNTKEEDFEENCLDIFTYLSGHSEFYKYNSKTEISSPVHSVISWAIAK